ncbi:excisionase [Kibdelosporangium aridum]|uniref:Excisionase n=1 Tax=Kibdelosporangium aridum TaxID=2030 RepID=A0A428YBF1_KIBAR|nr:helix-turn-helix domain-containing protein [Kibdelosporangium aridum]RSM64868.1 excisionase [Kibdelosporangium aridum]
MSAAEFESLWGIEEVSAFLGIPVHTIRGWRTKNYGPPGRKVGKHLRYDPAKVRAWFEDLDQDDAA